METQTALQVPAPRKRRLLILLLAALIMLGLAGILVYSILKRDHCYSVGEVWQHAQSLRDARLCVKGKAVTSVMFTAMLCDPPTCGCNQSSGSLELVSEEKILRNPKVSERDTITIAPTLNASICSGDMCTLTCSPFNPRAADYYRLVGKLSIIYLSDGRIVHLQLTDLDLPASRELVNGNWQPIPSGTFTSKP